MKDISETVKKEGKVARCGMKMLFDGNPAMGSSLKNYPLVECYFCSGYFSGCARNEK